FLRIGREVQHVDRFVEARIRVDVWTKPRTGGLEIGDQLTGFEVRASVERHVLDEVSEPLLFVGFEERTSLDRQTQRDGLLGPGILPNEIFQPVGKVAGSNGGIEGKWLLEVDARRRRLRGLRRDDPREQQSGERQAAVTAKISLH